MLCRITQSSDAHRTDSVSVMDHEQTMGVSSRVLEQKQQNIFGRISLFWSVELQGHPEQKRVFKCSANDERTSKRPSQMAIGGKMCS